MGEPAALSAVLSGYDTTVSCYHSLLSFARLLFEGLVRVAIEQIKFYMLAVHLLGLTCHEILLYHIVLKWLIK